jgi:glycosyltransferase involved in cell wall biosynthesis
VTQVISGSPGASHRFALVTGILDLGGTTTFLCNLGGELVRRNFAVRVLSFARNNPLAADFERLKIPVFTTDEKKLIYEDRLLLILKELASFKPSVALANLSAESFEVLRYMPKGVFRIGTAQADQEPVYRLLAQYAGDMDLLAAVSDRIQQQLQPRPEFAALPVRYLPHGVPIPETGAPRVTNDTGPLRILYLGRLQREQKRVQLFAEMFKVLEASGMPFHWTIAGTGPEENWLKTVLQSRAANQTVSFPGKVLYGEVPRLLAEHDVFLLASDYEGQPLSLLEAMVAGLVPVVSDLPSGIREVVDADTGKLIPPDNARGYAEAIVHLHEHRDELHRLAVNAEGRARREFTVSAMVERWLAVLPPKLPEAMAWPEKWSLKPILSAPNRWWFSSPMRWLRRMLR